MVVRKERWQWKDVIICTEVLDGRGLLRASKFKLGSTMQESRENAGLLADGEQEGAKAVSGAEAAACCENGKQ